MNICKDTPILAGLYIHILLKDKEHCFYQQICHMAGMVHHIMRQILNRVEPVEEVIHIVTVTDTVIFRRWNSPNKHCKLVWLRKCIC